MRIESAVRVPFMIAMVTVVFILVVAMVTVAFISVIVMHIAHGELDRIDAFTKRDYLGLICTCVVQELRQPSGLQVEADRQREIRICYPGNVAGSGLEMVRVATHWQ